MFTFDAVIDAVQNSKKTFVTTFVKNEKMAEALNGFVNEQTEYTKKAVKVGMDTATALSKGLGAIYGKYAYVPVSFQELVEQGILMSPKFIVSDALIDTSKLNKKSNFIGFTDKIKFIN